LIKLNHPSLQNIIKTSNMNKSTTIYLYLLISLIGYCQCLQYKTSVLKSYDDRNTSPVSLTSTGCSSLQYYVLFEGKELVQDIKSTQHGVSSLVWTLVKSASPKQIFQITFDTTYELHASLLNISVVTPTNETYYTLNDSPIICKSITQLNIVSRPIITLNRLQQLEIQFATDIKHFMKSDLENFSCKFYSSSSSTCTIKQDQYSSDVFIITTPITSDLYSQNTINVSISFLENTIVEFKDIITPFNIGSATLSAITSYPTNLSLQNDYLNGKSASIVLSTNVKGNSGIILSNNGQVFSSFHATLGNSDSKTLHLFINYDLNNVLDSNIKVMYKTTNGIQESYITVDPTLTPTNMTVTADITNDSSSKLPILKVKANDVIISNSIQATSNHGSLSIEFPFGIKKDSSKYNYVVDQIYPFVLNSQNTVSIDNKKYIKDTNVVIPSTSPLTQDITAPTYSIKSKKSYDSLVSYQLTITDQTSGVYKIFCINTNQEFYAMDTIISGSMTNGVFEFTIDLNQIVSSSSRLLLEITDLYGNSNTYQGDNIIYLDDNLNYPFDLFSNKIFIKDIIHFEFNSNTFDTSFKPQKNSLFFNLANADKSLKPIIKLLNGGGSFVGSFDQTIQKYRIDFYLPSKPSYQILEYELVLQGSTFSFKSLQSLFGDTAIIKFINSDIDNYPPMFSKIEFIGGNQTTLSSSNENKQIGWRFTITDRPSGFKYGNITIKSNLNPKPTTYQFEYDKILSGNFISGVYEVKFSVSGSSPSQVYMISSVVLVDHNGATSSYPPEPNQLSPFHQLDGYSHSISVTTPRVVESVLPTLRSWSVVQIYRDSYRITFSTSDSGSLISPDHTPIIYIVGYQGRKQEIIPQLQYNTNNVYSYEATFNIDYLLAYHGCLLSVYGIYDRDLNINGYSSMDLKSLGHTYYIKKQWSVDPIVDSFTSIGQNGGLLTIYGKRFSSSSSRIDSRTTVTPIFVSTNVIVYDYPPTLTTQTIKIISTDNVDYSFSIKPTLPLLPTNNAIYVDALSTCRSNCGTYISPYPSLSVALKNIQERTTIVLKDGIYKGDENMNSIIESQYINIRPMNSSSNVIFDCENYYQLFNVKGSESFLLTNLTITNCSSTLGGALYFENSIATLQNIKFINNKATNGGAIYLLNTKLNLINSVFKQNKVITGGAAIYSYLSTMNIKGYFTTFVNNTNLNNGLNPRDILCKNSTLNIDDDVYIKDISVKCLQGCNNFYSQRDICQTELNKPREGICGDNICTESESCLSCPNDCPCYIDGMVQETFQSGCSPTYFIPDNSFNNTVVEPCVSLSNTSLPIVLIENFMGGIKNIVVRLFGYVLVDSSKDVPFNFQGTNFGLIFKVNGQQQFYFNQNTFFNETKTLYLVDKHVHFIEILLFTTIIESSERSFKLSPFEDSSTKLFYSNLVCGDGILNERETIEETSTNPDILNYYCITDLEYPIFKDQPVCGDGICNEDPDECFRDCYIEYTPICSATKVIEGAISPGFSVGDDTLGNLISNQFVWRLPGSEHLSFGVDIVTGEEAMAPIFQFDYCQDAATNVLEDVYRGKLYQIPVEFNGKAVPECTFSTTTESYKSTKELATSKTNRILREAEASFSINSGFYKGGASASFSKDKSNSSAKKISKSNSQRIFKTDLLYKSTYVELDTKRVSFHPALLEQFNQVQTYRDMLKVIERHGTHFYKKSYLGGQLSQIAVTDESNVDESNEDAWSESFKASFSASASGPAFSIKTSNSGSFDRSEDSKTQQQRNDQSTVSKIITYGGVPAAFSAAQDGVSSPLFGEWAQSIDVLPVPIDYQLYPISFLINEQWVNQHGVNIKEYWDQAEEMFYATQLTSENEIFGIDYSIIFDMKQVIQTPYLFTYPDLDITYYTDEKDEEGTHIIIPITSTYTDRFGNKQNTFYSNRWPIDFHRESTQTALTHSSLPYDFRNASNPYINVQFNPSSNMKYSFRYDFNAPDFINSAKKPIIKLIENEIPIDFTKPPKIISWKQSLGVVLDENGLITNTDTAYGISAFESKWSYEWNTNIKFVVPPMGGIYFSENVNGIYYVSNFYLICKIEDHDTKCIDQLQFSFDGQSDTSSPVFERLFAWNDNNDFTVNKPMFETFVWHSFSIKVPSNKNNKIRIHHPGNNIALGTRMNWMKLMYPQNPNDASSWKFDVSGYHIKENQLIDNHINEWMISTPENGTRTIQLDPIQKIPKQLFFYNNYNYRDPTYLVPDGWDYPYFHAFINSTTEIGTTKFKDFTGTYTYWQEGQLGYIPTPEVE